ncbi:hypothetical protein GGF46_003597 [Coemansia sp. RSA 552]|nr:hypothetical protein GGF46_003597 [Coemansia sp. RSA 552]
MDSYRDQYQKYPASFSTQPPPQYAPAYQQPMGFPAMNARSPPMPTYGIGQLKPQPQQLQTTTTSSRVINEAGCRVLRSNRDADAVEHSARQVVMDGKLFIEHIPGHNIIFVPIEVQPNDAIRSHIHGSRISKPRNRAAPLTRPSNVFFKYRSVKQRELQLANPRLNQTVISRMVADHWRNESEAVKDHFKQMYKTEMREYELQKKIHRARPDYRADSSDFVYLPQGAASVPADYPQVSRAVASPIIEPSMDNPQEPTRHRSFTMPSLDNQQHNIARIID